MKRVLITCMISLCLLIGTLFYSIPVYAYASYATTSQHYRVEISQTSNTSVTVSWAPSSTSNSRYIDFVHLIGVDGQNQRTVYLCLYGSDSVSFNVTSGTITSWSLAQDNSYNVGSELYNESQINSSTSQILEEIQDLNAFLITMNSNELQTQAYVSNINTQIQNIISNGLNVRLMNYDILITQIPIIAYYVDNDAVIQNTNDFIGGKTLILDFPIYKGFTANNNAYLTTDTTEDPYIIIVANNYSFQIFANTTFTPATGWSDVQTVRTGYKRYSNTLQINYMIVKNNKNGSSYTGAKYCINYTNNALNSLNNYQYIPIFYGKYSECPKEFLDLVGLLTDEENAANETSSTIQNQNESLSDAIDDVDQIEQNLTSGFNDAMSDIDLTNQDPVNIFGSKFVNSASWVATQFNNLTVGNPFGSLLTFALILGIGLLILGKVL